MAKDFAQITDGTGTKIKTIQKMQGADTVEVQSFAQDWDALAIAAIPNALDSVNVAGTESGDIDCEGMSTILLKVEYSANNVTAPFWIVLMDANSRRLYSVKITPANTGENDGIQETAYFHGEAVIMPTYGAKNFRVVLADTPTNSGSVSVWAKAV